MNARHLTDKGQESDTEKELLRLLEKYYHHKFMTSSVFTWLSGNVGMTFYDFIQWLKSRQHD